MKAAIELTRNGGRKAQPDQRRRAAGRLVTGKAVEATRTHVQLELKRDGETLAILLDPRLVQADGRTFVYAGLEGIDGAWCAQEWICQLYAEDEIPGWE